MREPSSPALRVSIDHLIEGALQYSSYVQVVSTEPRIRRTTVVEEQAAFDWRVFLETTYNDINEPVGNVLTTGTNEDRYKDRTWSANGGVRRDNRLGGNVELSQRLGSAGEQLPLPAAESTGDIAAGVAVHAAAAQWSRLCLQREPDRAGSDSSPTFRPTT